MKNTDVVVEAAKVTPAAGVTVMTFLGYQISDWVSMVTLIYTLTMLGAFIWKKIIVPWRDKRRHCGGDDAL
jgi:hypothetical protein